VTHCPSVHGTVRSGKWGIRRQEEGGEDAGWRTNPGDQDHAWRQILGDTQGPLPVMPKTGNSEQWHSTDEPDFGSHLPWPASSLPGREAETS